MDRRYTWHGGLKVLVGAVLGGSLIIQSTVAAPPIGDVTGLYVEANALKCDRSLMDGIVKNKIALGESRLNDCFSGYASAPASELRLVQNGKKLCGVLTECLGWNCQRLRVAVVAGTINDGEMRVYVGDGDAENVVLQPEHLRVKSLMLIPSSRTSNSISRTYISGAYRRTSAKLLNPALKQHCNPDLEGVVELNAGLLRVNGRELSVMPPDGLDFEKAEPKRVRSAPPVAEVVLKSGSASAKFEDERSDGNWIPRWVKVINRSGNTLNLFAQGNLTCAGYIRDERDRYDEGKHPRPSTMRHTPNAWPYDSVPVSPGVHLWVQSCWGMRVVLSASEKQEVSRGKARSIRRAGEAHE